MPPVDLCDSSQNKMIEDTESLFKRVIFVLVDALSCF